MVQPLLGSRPQLRAQDRQNLYGQRGNGLPYIQAINIGNFCSTVNPHTNQPLFLSTQQQANWTAFAIAATSHLGTVTCPACNGQGHSVHECATVKHLTRFASQHKVTWEWGCVKGVAYYTAWANNNQDLVLENRLRMLAAGNARKRKRSR